MRLLDKITIYHGTEQRLIELYQGDLTNLTPDEEIDVLVVSAFPNDYSPTQFSLIGALHRKGISVAQLAAEKAVDLRQAFSCWMSKEIDSPDAGIQFKRILCFEPLMRGNPPEVVGDIFRSLAPFLGENPPVSTVAMPLVASGDQEVPASAMLPALVEAAAHWMAIGLPLKRLKIVEYSAEKAAELQQEFAHLKERYSPETLEGKTDSRDDDAFEHDIFVSYSHENQSEASSIVHELQHLRPDLRIFFDRLNLNVGHAWQQEIFEALDSCRRVLAIYSPSYITSKVCREEFNIAWARSRDSDEKILFPIYLYTARLPTYMKMCQYVDCREGNRGMIHMACERLLSGLMG